MSLNVIYEDNHIIVVEKKPNTVVQADSTGDKDMLTNVKEYIKKKYNKPGNVFVGLVHRLDRPVGGIMVFARTSKGASRLSDLIRRHKMNKKYLCVLQGDFKNLSNNWTTITHYIEKDLKLNRVKISDKEFGNAKEATLRYRLLDVSNELALVEVDLITGRPHQIRAQMTMLGCSIYGDNKYGKGKPGEDIALWSYMIGFDHPTKKEYMEFTIYPDNEVFPWNNFKKFIE